MMSGSLAGEPQPFNLAEANREMNRAAYHQKVQPVKRPNDPVAGRKKKCKHCTEKIVWVNFGWRPRWMHEPNGASFHDGQYEFCHMTPAEPEDEPDGT